ncbi:MAG: hypothetical protein CR994_03965 [Maribacter sp.]|nr:MAG: hypothetical protein CR994_03965 [Maribacter sp.]
MSIFTKVALRNVTRHSGRNIFIGSSIALAVGLLFFILSISAGVEKLLVANLVQIETGSVSFSLSDETLEGKTNIDRKGLDKAYGTINGVPEVLDIRERVHSRSLINSNNKSADINLRGIDWEKEQPLFSSLRFENPKSIDSIKGSGLLISRNVANKLEVKENEECTILVQTVNGTLNMESYPVKGIYKNISGWANTMVFMNLDDVKALINTSLPTNVLIDAKNIDNTPTILSKVNSILESEFQDNMDLESYKSQSMVASTIANANKYGFLSIVFFLQIISFFGIVFVVKNNVIERNKEIGTLLAIGYKPRSIRLSFVLETFVVAVISSLLGLIIFGILTALLSVDGVYLGDSATLIFGSSVLKPFFHVPNLVTAFIIGLLYPLFSAIWSTRKVRKVDPLTLLYDK